MNTEASLFPSVGVMLQITASLRNFLKGGYNKVYNSNINIYNVYMKSLFNKNSKYSKTQTAQKCSDKVWYKT